MGIQGETDSTTEIKICLALLQFLLFVFLFLINSAVHLPQPRGLPNKFTLVITSPQQNPSFCPLYTTSVLHIAEPTMHLHEMHFLTKHVLRHIVFEGMRITWVFIPLLAVNFVFLLAAH